MTCLDFTIIMTSKNLSPQLSIKISDFRVQKGKYVEYLILWSYKTKLMSSFYARYSKLNALHEELLKTDLGINKKKFPRKSLLIDNLKPEFIQKRAAELNNYFTNLTLLYNDTDFNNDSQDKKFDILINFLTQQNDITSPTKSSSSFDDQTIHEEKEGESNGDGIKKKSSFIDADIITPTVTPIRAITTSTIKDQLKYNESTLNSIEEDNTASCYSFVDDQGNRIYQIEGTIIEDDELFN